MSIVRSRRRGRTITKSASNGVVAARGALIRSLAVFCGFFPSIVAAQTPAAPPTPYSREQEALKAYEDKHYAESAHLFDTAFAAGLSRSDDAYIAARSYALAGDLSKSVAY